MSHPKEITVRLKGDDCKHSNQFLVYEDDIQLSPQDPTIMNLIQETRSSVKEPAVFDECVVSIKMVC